MFLEIKEKLELKSIYIKNDYLSSDSIDVTLTFDKSSVRKKYTFELQEVYIELQSVLKFRYNFLKFGEVIEFDVESEMTNQIKNVYSFEEFRHKFGVSFEELIFTHADFPIRHHFALFGNRLNSNSTIDEYMCVCKEEIIPINKDRGDIILKYLQHMKYVGIMFNQNYIK